MKYRMLLSIGLFCMLLFYNCKQENDNCPEGWQEATIIGEDLRRCACCGGYFIDLGQDTVRAFVLPAGFTIDPFSEFPLDVCLSFEDMTGPCQDFGRLIVIAQMERR